MKSLVITEEIKNQFWSRVSRSNDNECWKWLGDKGHGQGRFYVSNVGRVAAHPIAYFIANNRWPSNRIIKSCGQSDCMNPKHFYEASNIDEPSFKEKFWNKVEKGGPDECWNWTGARQSQGYGQLHIGDVAHRAHRVAFYLTNGKWPNVICHSCDNPPCCNPTHLIDGTCKQNMIDRSDRGRCNAAKGELNANAKLSDLSVEMMRSDFVLGITNQRVLARKYGFAQSLVSRILNRKHR